MNKDILDLRVEFREHKHSPHPLIKIKDCPFCKHKTAMVAHFEPSGFFSSATGFSFSGGNLDYPPKYFDCLTCGKQIGFTAKEIGEVVK